MKTTNKTNKTTKNTKATTIITPTGRQTDTLSAEELKAIRDLNKRLKQSALEIMTEDGKQAAAKVIIYGIEQNKPITYTAYKMVKHGTVEEVKKRITLYDFINYTNDKITNELLRIDCILYNLYANELMNLSAKGDMGKKYSEYEKISKRMTSKQALDFRKTHENYKNTGKNAIAKQLDRLTIDIFGENFVRNFLQKDIKALIDSITTFRDGAVCGKGSAALTKTIEQVIVKKRNYAKLHEDNPDGYSYAIKTVNEK